MSDLNESYDDYPRVVAKLNDRWRVIECRDRIQWILQRQDAQKGPRGPIWRGRSYCRTSEALRRCCREEGIEIDSGVLAPLFELPVWLEEPAKRPAREPAPAN